MTAASDRQERLSGRIRPALARNRTPFVGGILRVGIPYGVFVGTRTRRRRSDERPCGSDRTGPGGVRHPRHRPLIRGAGELDVLAGIVEHPAKAPRLPRAPYTRSGVMGFFGDRLGSWGYPHGPRTVSGFALLAGDAYLAFYWGLAFAFDIGNWGFELGLYGGCGRRSLG